MSTVDQLGMAASISGVVFSLIILGQALKFGRAHGYILGALCLFANVYFLVISVQP